VWLGLHDGRSLSGFETRDEARMKDIMAQRYEKKRWYVQPTDEMYNEARTLNSASPQSSRSNAAASRSQATVFDTQVPQ